MSSLNRTVAAGLGVGAVCLVMASLRWQHLLMFFALAGVGWAVWTWFKSSVPKRTAFTSSSQSEPAIFSEHRSLPPRNSRKPTADNVYQFPPRWNVSDVAGS